MRRPLPVARTAAAVWLVAWLAVSVAPASGFADEAGGAAEQDEAAAEPPVPAAEPHWYDTALHNANVAVDLIVIRPLAAGTLAAGAALFVPAAIMTLPNGWDSVKEAYQRFVDEPVEYFASRPLGEF